MSTTETEQESRDAWAAVDAGQDLKDMEARKDAAYLERNQCVALLARMALALGLRAGVTKTAIEGWSEDWHNCVYIELPTGQASWHFHDSQADLFAGLPKNPLVWDGHSTSEKYRRVNAAFRDQSPYLTRVAVAGNRLSDLIDALRQFDPDTRIRVGYMDRENGRVRLDGVEAIVLESGEHVYFPGSGALL